MLSTLSFTGSALLWNGFRVGTANSLAVSVVGANYVLHDGAERIRFGAGVPSGWSGNNQTTVTGPISSVTSITIDGGSDTVASDMIALNAALSTAGSVTVTGFDRINCNNAITTTGGSGGAVTLTANATATSTLTVLGAATIRADGAVALTGRGGIFTAGNVMANNQAITFVSAVTLTGSVTLNPGTGTATFANTVAGGTNNLTILGNAVLAAAATELNNLSVSRAAALNGGAVTSSGGQVYNGPVTLGANTVLNAGSGNVTFASTVNGAFSLTVNSTGTTTFGSAVGNSTLLTSLTTDAGGITAMNGGSLTTTGAQTYNDSVLLGASTTLTAGTVSFGTTGTVDGVFRLTVNSATTVLFLGPTGNTTPLTGLTVNAGNAITVGANINVGGGIITLNPTGGGVNQAAGALSAASLLLTGSGTFQLNQPNTVFTLAASLSGTAALTYQAAGDLTVDTVSAVSGITTVNSSVTLNVAGSLFVNRNISVGTGSISLNVGLNATFNNVTLTGASFSASIGGGFAGALNLLNLGTVTMVVEGNFSGQLSAGEPGIIQGITIGRSLTGSISAKTLSMLTVHGDMTATGRVTVHGSGEIGGMVVDGDLGGMVTGETITTITMGSLSGTVSSSGSGLIGTLTVQQSIAGPGAVSAENISTLTVGHVMAGTITVSEVITEPGTGILQSMVIGSGSAGDALSGTVMVKAVNSLTVHGFIAASGRVTAHGSGEIGGMVVDGDLGGTVTSETITTITMGSLSGTVSSSGSGLIGTLSVQQSIAATGRVSAQNITTLAVGHVMAGTITVSEVITEPGTGVLQALDVGSIAASGLVSAKSLPTTHVHGDMAGRVIATASLGDLSADAGTSGSIVAGTIQTVLARAATGSGLLQITQAGVRRQLLASYLIAPPPSTPVFTYFYDATSPGDPQLSVRIANRDSIDTRFDLSLITDSSTSGFNLARVDALNSSGSPTRSGLRNLAVTGNLLATLTPGALSFFGLPAGTPGGVQLPQDALASVAAQNNVVAGTIQATSIQAFAFGSFTVAGVTMPGETATNSDAAHLLAPGTLIVQAAANAFAVPFSEATKVTLFMDTGPGANFDSKNVLFAKQIPGGASVTALVTLGIVGNFTIVQAVDLNGNGGSIQTSQSITMRVTSTGALAGLILGAPDGLIAAVTAPTITGNIDVSNGPITNIIQSTVGDFGATLIDATGNIIGTTTVHTNGGIAASAKIISRGNLISQVLSNRDINGVVAAQGDIGAFQFDATGNLSRFGGIQTSSGGDNGQIVALGNIVGDIIIHGGLTGRIAVKGRVVAGFGSIGILGNITITGNLDASSAIVSAGVIGDRAHGTVLNTGNVSGIVAAEGNLNIGHIGSSSGAFILANATGANAAAIDAIFTENHVPLSFDRMGLDLAGLNLILRDLAALTVVGDTLTGPTP
jgi:hypothetical protein